ncbi:LANO_0D03708g1_1 [Lachancea nothofagi CBS 11611]|uniref:Dynein light chain n=1 Tax=Lachancea nothofagi CBS 11611 TaxID=1266666 RepID=A0A1G4JFH7_9SACH|nr:LANO_0D03708g1_1 [Lachancea nothofagi CBS 11611]
MSPQPVLKASDISPELKDAILNITSKATEDFSLEREIAGVIKKELDIKHGNTWHVIVGRSFGSYVTHEKGHFMYFYIGPLAFLVFKTA